IAALSDAEYIYIFRHLEFNIEFGQRFAKEGNCTRYRQAFLRVHANCEPAHVIVSEFADWCLRAIDIGCKVSAGGKVLQQRLERFMRVGRMVQSLVAGNKIKVSTIERQ